MYNISSYIPFRGIFLAEISPTFDKINVFVSMATMEAPWMLGMFQLLILEGLVYVKYILVEAVI